MTQHLSPQSTFYTAVANMKYYGNCWEKPPCKCDLQAMGLVLWRVECDWHHLLFSHQRCKVAFVCILNMMMELSQKIMGVNVSSYSYRVWSVETEN